jgi:hypothetical protein
MKNLEKSMAVPARFGMAMWMEVRLVGGGVACAPNNSIAVIPALARE